MILVLEANPSAVLKGFKVQALNSLVSGVQMDSAGMTEIPFIQARNLPVLSLPSPHVIISHFNYSSGLQSACFHQERAVPCFTVNSGCFHVEQPPVPLVLPREHH